MDAQRRHFGGIFWAPANILGKLGAPVRRNVVISGDATHAGISNFPLSDGTHTLSRARRSSEPGRLLL